MKPKKWIKASVSLEPDLHREANVLAARAGMSLTKWVRGVVEHAVKSAERRTLKKMGA